MFQYITMKILYLLFIGHKPLLMGLWLTAGLVAVVGQLPAQSNKKAMDKNKALIRQGFERWANGSGSFFDLLADDMVWTITGRSPIAKTYTSKAQFMKEAIDPLNRRFSKKIAPSLRGLYADGDMVVAIWDGEAMATDGVMYKNTYSWYMKVKGNQIVEVIAFFDSIELVDIWNRVPDPQPH
jgi:ketosteroid isomerase-like protein